MPQSTSQVSNQFLGYLQPLCVFLPEIKESQKKVQLREKIIWTSLTLLIFLVCCQIPLFGILKTEKTDSLYWARMILASNRGSLMELGISPIITSSMISQILVGMNLVQQGETQGEKALFEAVQKLMGFIITFVQSVFYVLSGMYGPVGEIGTIKTFLLIVQLNIAGAIVVLLDELMSKGYGLGSGLNLFIATNVCETIVWHIISPTRVDTVKGKQFEGALVQYIFSLISGHGGSNRLDALVNSTFRSYLPGLFSIFMTSGVFALVVYLQGFKVDIPIQHSKASSQKSTYPIKLLYNSTTPIMLQSTLVSNLFMVSQYLFKRSPSGFITILLGTWANASSVTSSGDHMVPVGGICYYMTKPSSFSAVLDDPLHCLMYMLFMLVTCAIFSITWLSVSGSQAKDVAKQLKDQDMIIAGHREASTVQLLNRYIPIAASFGGLCIGALSIVADFSGAIGSGTGILLAVSIVSNLIETINKEQQDAGGKSLIDILF
ncbi:MAG: hypothetical protein MHMPM18_000134 [Marteilia pararefringens]